jgi:hypothetical protein
MKCIVAVCAGLAVVGTLACPCSIPAAERELLQDPHFQRGFVLLASPPGKRVASAELHAVDRSGTPVWDLAQWSSKHSVLPRQPEVLAGGAVRYANAGKAVVIGPPSAKEADLTLAVNASAEYGTRPRDAGDPWVHLLTQQTIDNPPCIAELTACRLHIEARLNHSLLAVQEGYSPSRHAAQFQIFLTISNRRSGSPGFGQYLWFGVPLYDNRERLPSGHKAQDAGDTKMFIYTLAATDLTNESTHDRQWVTIDKDLLPHIRAALQHAWSRGFLTESQDFSDYRIGGAFVGWEVPGIFDVEMQIRNFSLRATASP